ncbi:hypothetical protein [Halomonas sp. E19]|uniref:hypothetical protein n=1 Tax=Halomonas sp. E19 TaxID=3397247 RepID=UPI0040349A7C
MTAASPLTRYREAVERQGFAPDAAQQRAAVRLDACFQALYDKGARSRAGSYPASIYGGRWGAARPG